MKYDLWLSKDDLFGEYSWTDATISVTEFTNLDESEMHALFEIAMKRGMYTLIHKVDNNALG